MNAVSIPKSQQSWLIVNADDYAYFDCVSRGILHAAKHGIVTATGILANSALFEEHVAWMRDCDSPDLGVHLNLTDRIPLTQGMRDRLARRQGRFQGKFAMARAVMTGAIRLCDVEHEWRAQIERCLAEGLTIRFLNSHEHIHMLPFLFTLAHGLAREYGIAHVRFPTSEMFQSWAPAALLRDAAISMLALLNKNTLAYPVADFLGMGESGHLSIRYLERALPRLKAGRVYELMCHPGYHDAAEVSDPRLIDYHDWEGELAVLTNPDVKELLMRHGVRVIGYRDLADWV
jgi:predicted glycoside hydrolase/deacetylase ChbG (UPF0249 family)